MMWWYIHLVVPDTCSCSGRHQLLPYRETTFVVAIVEEQQDCGTKKDDDAPPSIDGLCSKVQTSESFISIDCMGFPTIRLLHDPLNQDLPVSLGRRVETALRSECRKFVYQHGGVKRSSGFLIYMKTQAFNQIVHAKASKELKKQSIITCNPLTSAGMSRLVTFRIVFQAVRWTVCYLS